MSRRLSLFWNVISGCDRMKTSPYSLMILNAIVALALTVLSFQYVQPKDCYNFCDVEEGVPCPAGSCRVGEQKAGWPIPVFIDAPSPSSPLLVSGVLGVDDYPHPMAMFFTVLFYSMLVWFLIFIIGLLQGQRFDQKVILLALPMNVLLAVVLWMHYFSTGYVNYLP